MENRSAESMRPSWERLFRKLVYTKDSPNWKGDYLSIDD